VIVEPWDLDFEKGDILFQYRPIQVEWLKQHGYLNKEEEEF
jgi:initiation factor 1A